VETKDPSMPYEFSALNVSQSITCRESWRIQWNAAQGRIVGDCRWRTAVVHEKNRCAPEVHLKGDDEPNGCRWPILQHVRSDC